MARRGKDWRSLFLRYKKQNQKSGISIKDWAKRNKISYSQCRQKFSEVRAEIEAEIKAKTGTLDDQSTNNEDPPLSLANNDVTPAAALENSQFFLERINEPKKGGQDGNKNAFIHGIYSETFGADIWAASPDLSQELRYRSMLSRMLYADSKALEYKNMAMAIEFRIVSENRMATKEEAEQLQAYANKFDSCLKAAAFINGQIEQMENNLLNRAATKATIAKIRADVGRINQAARKLSAESSKIERDNLEHKINKAAKTLQGELLKANIDKSRKEIELKDAQIRQISLNSGENDDDDFNQITSESRDLMLSAYIERFTDESGQ